MEIYLQQYFLFFSLVAPSEIHLVNTLSYYLQDLQVQWQIHLLLCYVAGAPW